MSGLTFTAGQEGHRESCALRSNSSSEQELLYHADLKLIICIMSPVPMVRSLIPVHISGVIRPVCIPLYHQNLHGHKENSATSWQSTHCGRCFKWTVKENQFGNCKHVSLSTGLWFRTRYESTIVKLRSLFSDLLPSSPGEAGIIPRRKHGHDVWFFPTCCVLYTHASELLSFTVI